MKAAGGIFVGALSASAQRTASAMKRQRPGMSPALHRKLRLALFLLAFRGATMAQTDVPPGAAEQERILTLMRQYFASYRQPDVAWDQTITGFQGRAGSGKWHKEFTLYSTRIAKYDEGREYWRPAGGNGKPLPHAKWHATMLNHAGFKPLEETRAAFVWDRWDTVRGHRVAVFDYKVSQRDSGWVYWKVSGTDSAIVPYSGYICVDPATGAIWRFSDVVTEIPARFPDRYVSGVEDYDQVTIGATQYLVRMTRTVTMIQRGEGGAVRDEWVYRNYQKFDAASSITFFGVDSTITFDK
jgi:hypothetical protein